MATSNWHASARLDTLTERARQYDFFQLLYQLESLGLFDQLKLISQHQQQFAASDVDSLAIQADGRIELKQKFFSLTGPGGILPEYIIEDIAQASKSKHSQLQDFLDLLTQRLVQITYRIWKSNRYHLQENHPLLDFIGALSGKHSQAVPSLSHSIFWRYAGVLSKKPRANLALIQIIKDQLSLHCQLTMNVGCWSMLDQDNTPTLGHAQLNHDAVLGRRAFLNDQRFQIDFPRLNFKQYCSLLPHGGRRKKLLELVHFFVQSRCKPVIKITLPSRKIPAQHLGRNQRLGWTSWLSSRTPRTHDHDLHIEV